MSNGSPDSLRIHATEFDWMFAVLDLALAKPDNGQTAKDAAIVALLKSTIYGAAYRPDDSAFSREVERIYAANVDSFGDLFR
jgi:hypothetical protein